MVTLRVGAPELAPEAVGAESLASCANSRSGLGECTSTRLDAGGRDGRTKRPGHGTSSAFQFESDGPAGSLAPAGWSRSRWMARRLAPSARFACARRQGATGRAARRPSNGRTGSTAGRIMIAFVRSEAPDELQAMQLVRSGAHSGPSAQHRTSWARTPPRRIGPAPLRASTLPSDTRPPRPCTSMLTTGNGRASRRGIASVRARGAPKPPRTGHQREAGEHEGAEGRTPVRRTRALPM